MKFKYDVTTRKRSSGTNSRSYIMIHHTGGVTSLKNMTNYLAKNKATVSAHYVIGKDGSISRIGLDSYILWHAGKGNKIPGKINSMNYHSIGIEVISNGVNFTEDQIKALAELVKFLMKEYKIVVNNVIRHKDYSTRKWDIGDNFYKVVGADSFDFWKKENLSEEKTQGFYRKLVGKSVFRDTEAAGKVLMEGTLDEKIAVIELLSVRRAEKLMK